MAVLNYNTPESPDDPSGQWQLKKLKHIGIGVAGAAVVWVVLVFLISRAHRSPRRPPPTSSMSQPSR